MFSLFPKTKISEEPSKIPSSRNFIDENLHKWKPPEQIDGGVIQRKAGCACGGGCPHCQGKSQDLSMSQPGDASEIEADNIAAQVMELPDKKIQQKPLLNKINPVVQTKSEDGGIPVIDSALSNKINTSRGTGSNLDDKTHAFMQSRFGTDFSNVKIHTGGEAAYLNRKLNAKAFTVGSDIYFNEGKYRPDTDNGKRLLAHELTHTIQQKENAALQPMIQRDLAVEPTTPDAKTEALEPKKIENAIKWNQAAFTDADEISLLRDVLGISAEPAVIDENFISALVRYQSNYGLAQDGLLGAGTAQRLAAELQAEANFLGADAAVGTTSKMALTSAQRRTRLRSRVVSRLGRMLHQGFIGSRENPTGIVTVRSGFTDPTVAERNNRIGINYTGSNADNSRWLQFGFQQMWAIDPGTRRKTYLTGGVITSAGGENYSDATTFFWAVDTVPATGNMYYEAGGSNERVAQVSTEIIDQPRRFNGEAENFAASFATRPNKVNLLIGFDTYLVVNNNRVVYHVRWNMYFNFNTSVSPTPDVRGTYEVLTAGAASRLPAALKTVLDAGFPTNTVP